MIFISSPTFDLSGTLILGRTELSDTSTQSRRVRRTKTLDGGVSISDMGYTHGDRTFNIVAERSSRADYERATYLHQTYPLLQLSCKEGLFLGSVESVNVAGGKLYLTFLVLSKESS